jgi:uncharacterized protein YdaU (DUF1376 family)
MLERLPWFKFCPADYLLDTLDLTHAEHGVYCILVFTYYWQGGLPCDREQLYRVARAHESSSQTIVERIIKRYFHESDGKLIHHRIERDLENLREFLVHQSEAGKASAAARRKTPAKKNTTHKGNGAALPGFSAFWEPYPRKQAKADAIKAWSKLNPDDALQARIVAAVAAQKNNGQWSKENGKFIPYPATWLTGRRWEDESPKPPERTVAI